MRIVSKYRDYYDGPFKKFALDPTNIFVRESKEIIIPRKEIQFIRFGCNNGKHTFEFTSGLIGFCGRIYPFLKRETGYHWNYVTQTDEIPIDPKTEYYYNFYQFSLRNSNIRKAILERWSTNISRISDIDSWLTSGLVSGWSWQFNAVTYKPLLDLFLKHNIAYFVINQCDRADKELKLVTYPILKEYEFFKQFDVYRTFQEIDMFLNNQLVKHDDRKVIIPDILKAQTHGFDKWSFRKMPKDKNENNT